MRWGDWFLRQVFEAVFKSIGCFIPAKTYPLELLQSSLIIYFLAISGKRIHTLSTLGQATFLNFWEMTQQITQKKNSRGSTNTTFWLSVFFFCRQVWDLEHGNFYHGTQGTQPLSTQPFWPDFGTDWSPAIGWVQFVAHVTRILPCIMELNNGSDSQPPTVVTFQIYSHFFHFHDYGGKGSRWPVSIRCKCWQEHTNTSLQLLIAGSTWNETHLSICRVDGLNLRRSWNGELVNLSEKQVVSGFVSFGNKTVPMAVQRMILMQTTLTPPFTFLLQ